MTVSNTEEPGTDYRELLAEVLSEIRAARVRAGLAVNAERTLLYWRIGRLILDRQRDCLLYTSPSPRDRQKTRMPSSA